MKTIRRTWNAMMCLSAIAAYTILAQVPLARSPSALNAPGASDVVLSGPPDPAAETLLLAQADPVTQDVLLNPIQTELPVALDQQTGNWVSLASSPSPRTIVIRSGSTDSKSQSRLEEDLNVMSRILTKAVKEKAREDDALTAMGMKIRTLASSGASPFQNIYLEGYGALFLVNVGFPLLAPPEPTKEETPKEPTDSTWEEARRELYGPKESAWSSRLWFNKEKAREAYDSKKVERLKDSLIEALKNATHIRNLKPDEFITVVVVGRENAPVARIFRTVDARAGQNVHSQALAVRDYDRGNISVARKSADETTMTLRVKKSDADAFAKGTLEFDQFKKKVAVSTY